MNIVNIDAETFEAMLSKFESFATRMEHLCRLYGDKESEWLDNQDVCMLLNISPRTLQTLRDNVRWRIPKSTTRSITNPKMWKKLSHWWMRNVNRLVTKEKESKTKC